MIRLIQALLSGIFVVLILDFFVFLALFLHYIEALDIPFYFNAFFIDNQPWLFLLLATIMFALLIGYNRIKIVTIAVIIAATLISLMPLIPSVGLWLGNALFTLPAYEITIDNQHYRGTLLYQGRGVLTLFDDDLQRNVTLQLPTAHP